MFSQPIVFVVGAGASAEFGMPTGAEMNARIAQALNFNTAPNRTVIGDRAVFDMLAIRFGTEFKKYHAAATELAVRIGEFDFIDEALQWFSATPEIVLIGKVEIVRQILLSERGGCLFNAQNPELIRSDNYEQTWLPSFLSMAMGSLKKEQAREAFRNVTIINFNYDRTIEHFLVSRLRTNFNLDSNEASGVISNLKMVRPYGSIGPLPWRERGGVPFGAEIKTDYERLFALSGNVRTFTEQNLSDDLRGEITSAINAARTVVFLGFGFHQQNVALLQGTRGAEAWPRVLATVKNVDPANFETMKLMIANTIRCSQPSQIQLLERYAHQLLPSMKPTLMAAL